MVELGFSTRLPSQELAGFVCHRIKIDQGQEGLRILWIDEQTLLLRRMELPTEGMRKIMDSRGQLHSLKLWVDFHDAAVDRVPTEQTFELAILNEAVHGFTNLHFHLLSRQPGWGASQRA